MEFEKALKKVYSDTRIKERLNNPFRVFSQISDLIGDSYVDKKKAGKFFRISKSVNVFAIINEHGENSLNEILTRYSAVCDFMSEESYKRFANCVFNAIFPPKTPPVRKKPVRTAPATKNPAKPVTATPKVNAVVSPVSAPVKSTPASTSTQNYGNYAYSDYKIKKAIKTIVIICLIALAVGGAVAGILLSPSAREFFAKIFSWDVMQWVVGVAGSIVLAFLTFLLGDWLDGEVICEYPVFGIIAISVFSIANFVLKLLLAEYCFAFFICVAVTITAIGICIAIREFLDVEDEWGWGYAFAVFINCIFIIVILIPYIT